MAFYPLMHEINLEEALRARNLTFSPYLSRLARMQPMVEIPIKPYSDEYIDLSSDPYADDESSDDDTYQDVDDDCLTTYVNRLLFNSALDVEDERRYCQDEAVDLETIYPEWIRREAVSNDGDDEFIRSSFESERGIKYNRTPRHNPNKGLKKRRKKNTEEKGRDDTLPIGIPSGVQDGHPLFTASVYQLREYINSEVETKVRQIHRYYEDQFHNVNRERMTALTQLIKAKEICQSLQRSLEQEDATVQQYKSLCDRLASQVQLGKEAKRRRRQAKKQRKTELSTSFDETGDDTTEDRRDQESESKMNDDEFSKASDCADI